MAIPIELKKKVRSFDLAVSAGRKRQSSRTGFVHLFPGDETASDVVPLYENFCFALALFRQKTAESILEGKSLLERLLGFQTPEGSFPVYLHDFPKCWDETMALKVAPILIRILSDFGSVLGSESKEKVQLSLKKALEPSARKETLSPLWTARLEACLGKVPKKLQESPCFTDPSLPRISAREWMEWLISFSLVEKKDSYPIPYHPELQLFLGAPPPQEKGEPQPQPIEYFLGETEGLSGRLLADHPHQIYGALLGPIFSSTPSSESIVGSSFFWKGEEKIHSLALEGHQALENRILWELAADVDLEKKDLFEVALFCDASPETSLWIEGKKGLVFQLGEQVTIRTPHKEISLRFELIEGEGDFLGHISRGNRPSQIACRNRHSFEAFDWKIAIRTLRRNGACKIRMTTASK